MNDMDAIKEIEALKQLRARYCRLLDAKDWRVARTFFRGLRQRQVRRGRNTGCRGRQVCRFCAQGAGCFAPCTVHQVRAPEIELLSENTATGIWALEDFVKLAPGISLHGYGHYHETYEKSDGCWRIKSSKLTRLREDFITPIFSLYVSNWLRQRISKRMQRQQATIGSGQR